MSGQVFIREKAKKGFTMVELVVCFALLMLFIGAATTVLGTYSKVSMKVTDMEEMETVADLLLNQVIDTLADEDTKVCIDETQAQENRIVYTRMINDREFTLNLFIGSLSKSEKKGVFWDYKDNIAEGKEPVPLIGENTYLGNGVMYIKTSKVNSTRTESPRGVITVEIKLEGIHGGEYIDSRTFECRLK